MTNATLVRGELVVGLVTLSLAVCAAVSPALACVVGTGTPASCTEGLLDTCLSGGGTVTFDCGSAPKTIALSTTKAIGTDTTIDGGGAVTLQNSGSASFAVNSSAHFTAENLTLSGSGDGIDSAGGPVTATNCTFTGSGTDISGESVTATGCAFAYSITGISADSVTATNCTFAGAGLSTGISVGTAVTAAGCTFAGNGTDISAGKTVTATNCTFTGNDGISAGGPVTATDCTFTGMQFGISDGTVIATNCSFTGYSTAISASTVTATGCTFNGNVDGISAGPVTASNCTFTGNSGVAISAGPITATNCTFTSNGTGVDGSGAITNTILANNVVDTNCVGSFTDGGHNIDDRASCGFAGVGCANTSGTSFCNTDPKLDPAGLKNNGGPTQTIALCTAPGTPALCTAKSPAIDAGSNTACTDAPVSSVDQRGLPRFPTGDPVCDIGAFEVQPRTSGPAAPALSPAGLIALAIALGALGGGLLRWRAE